MRYGWRRGAFWLFLASAWAGVALAAPEPSPPYLTAAELDLAAWVAPPAAPGSPAELAERQQVLTMQRSRTPAMVAAARRDQEISLAGFAAVLGPGFSAERVPLTFALGQRVCRDAAGITGVAKRAWARPRPFVTDAAVVPVVAFSTDGSYPSGHATCGYLWALLLGELLPEYRAGLFARGIEYGDNRLTGGVHYPSDIAAGRLAAVAIMAHLRGRAAFEADLAAARAEVRVAVAEPTG